MAAITAAVIAAGGAAYNIIQGANAKAEAQVAAGKAAQSIAQMQEADKFKNLQVPTLGLEMAQQNVQARQAQQLQGLKDIGAAGVLGGLTALNQQGQQEDLALAAQAQEAQYARDFAQAQNAQDIEKRNLARQTGLETARLEGAQQAAAYGQSQINSGITGLAQTAGNVLVQSLKDQPLWGKQDEYTSQLTNKQTQQIGTNAQQAFAPQIASMQPPSTPMTKLNTPNVSNYDYLMKMQGLRNAQGQYEIAGKSPLMPLQWNQQYAPGIQWSSLGFK